MRALTDLLVALGDVTLIVWLSMTAGVIATWGTVALLLAAWRRDVDAREARR